MRPGSACPLRTFAAGSPAYVDGGLHSGGRHVRGAGAERDAEKHSLAAIEGCRVLRVSTAMVRDGRALEYVRRALS